MPNPQILLAGLIGLSYLLLLVIMVSGVLKLVQKGSALLVVIHRWATIPTIGLWTLVHFAMIVLANKAILNLATFAIFLSLVFGSAFTGSRIKNGGNRALHFLFGIVSFLLFTAFIFRFLLQAA